MSYPNSSKGADEKRQSNHYHGGNATSATHVVSPSHSKSSTMRSGCRAVASRTASDGKRMPVSVTSCIAAEVPHLVGHCQCKRGASVASYEVDDERAEQ